MKITKRQLKQIIKEEISATALGQWTPQGLEAIMLRGDTPTKPDDISEETWNESIRRCLAGEGAYCPLNYGVDKYTWPVPKKKKDTSVELLKLLKPKSYYDALEPKCTEVVCRDCTDALLTDIMRDHHEGEWDHVLWGRPVQDLAAAWTDAWDGPFGLRPKQLEAAVRSGEIKKWIFGIRVTEHDAFGGSPSFGGNVNWKQEVAGRLKEWNDLAWCVRRNGYRRLRRLGWWRRHSGPDRSEIGEERWEKWKKANKRGAWRSKKR